MVRPEARKIQQESAIRAKAIDRPALEEIDTRMIQELELTELVELLDMKIKKKEGVQDD